MLGHGIENEERGRAIKLVIAFNAHETLQSKSEESVKTLKVLATNGFSETAREILQKTKKRIPKRNSLEKCFLCKGKYENISDLAEKAVKLLEPYEYSNFLVGIELPRKIEEVEDEFKARFEVTHGESMRAEFGRLIGKRIAEKNRKPVDFLRPDIVILANPYSEEIRLQVNPLFVAGKYKKLIRGIPQSKWFCSNCHGRGCEKCNWTGKMYSESVEEIISKPFLEATGGSQSSFHASGREDIDARMLGTGRPFVIELAKPKRRFLNLDELEENVNKFGKGKIKVTNLRVANRDSVRKLKRGESTQKVYRVLIEFQHRVTDKDLRLLEKRLKNTTVAQKTPNRVLHRRADLTREKYIYDVNIKKTSPKKAVMRIRCQGGLYVKELVSGDEGRTTPSVSEILKTKATPIKLDVLKVIMRN